MTLKEILSITGKPGLFRIISHGKKNLIVEEITSKKKLPVSPREKVVSLGDIAMYTESGDKPLGEILNLLFEYKRGEEVDVKELVAKGELKKEFEAFLPDFDKERVYDNDVRKLFIWYNLLRSAGMDKFTEVQKSEQEETTEEKEADKKD